MSDLSSTRDEPAHNLRVVYIANEI